MFPHNVRMSHGRDAGKFVSLNRKKWRQNVLVAKQKIDDDSTAQDMYIHIKNRVIDVECLANGLWCKNCDLPISLRHTVQEQILGLASILHVKCTKCDIKHLVYTSAYTDDTNHKRFDSNIRVAFALLDSGIGEAQINTILSSLNIPIITSALLKRYERIVGVAVEDVAQDSCRDSIRLEKELTINAEKKQSHDKSDISMEKVIHNDDNPNPSNPPPTPLKASRDTAWTKRASGHSYNSKNGYTSLIGYHSGKVISYNTRSIRCARCERGHPKSDHDCRENFDGSARAMEPDMSVDLVTHNTLFKEENVVISVLIGDDDSSAIAAVRREAAHDVEKWSDINHAKKNLTSRLYKLKMSAKLVNYFGQFFVRVLNHNKDNVDSTAEALKNIVPHAFGHHDRCGEWLKCNEKDNDFIYRCLPKKQPLSDSKLFENLTTIFEKLSNNATKLAPCGSSQSNESFNNIVISKHAKNKFYGSSESFDYRVAAAVCQKNNGTRYIELVYGKLSLSCAKETLHFRNLKDKARNIKYKKSQTFGFKTQRFFRKQKRAGKISNKEKKEGISYQTECDLDGLSELIKNFKTVNDTTNLMECDIVIFDLETTGISKSDEICQISASYKTATFNVYMMPSKKMNPYASQVTGLHVKDGQLYLHNTCLKSLSMEEGLKSFIAFLENTKKKIILVAHNAFRFDALMILRNMKSYGLLDIFISVVYGFSDTLPILRKHVPDNKKVVNGYKLTTLALKYLGEKAIEGAHNGEADVKMLEGVLEAVGVGNDIIKQMARKTINILEKKRQDPIVEANRISLMELKPEVSNIFLTKMAKSGISLQILEKAFITGGEVGVKSLLSENIGKKPRVTNTQKNLNNIVNKLKSVLQKEQE